MKHGAYDHYHRREYHHAATSVRGFIQQLVLRYVSSGYWHYVLTEIPEDKDPLAVGDKRVEEYRVNITSAERFDRKAEGKANVHVLSHGQTLLMLATDGKHKEDDADHKDFWLAHRKTVRNARYTPIHVFGYSIRYTGGKPKVAVRIEKETFEYYKRRFLNRVRVWAVEDFQREFWELPFDAYGPVIKQLDHLPNPNDPTNRKPPGLLQLVNWERKKYQLPIIPSHCIRRRRKPIRVFDPLPGPDVPESDEDAWDTAA